MGVGLPDSLVGEGGVQIVEEGLPGSVVVETSQNFANEFSPPRAFSARHGAVAIAARFGALLHSSPGVGEYRAHVFRENVAAESAEVEGVEFGGTRIAVQQRAPDIEGDGVESGGLHEPRIADRSAVGEQARREICHTSSVRLTTTVRIFSTREAYHR